jgi:hypothetical protein
VRISDGTSAILTEVFRGYPQYLQADAGTVPRVGHDLLLVSIFQVILNPSAINSRLYISVSKYLEINN